MINIDTLLDKFDIDTLLDKLAHGFIIYLVITEAALFFGIVLPTFIF